MHKRLSVLLCAVAVAFFAGCHNNNNTSGYGIGWVTLTENQSSAPASGTLADGMTPVPSTLDFSSYIVTIDYITLVGKTVGTITAISVPEVIDLTKLKNISELWGSASIPNDTYLSAIVTLDYTSANVSVILGGVPVKATVIDPATNAAATTISVTITFDPHNQPMIVPTYASTNAIRMAVNFDMPASNVITVAAGVPTVTIAPYFSFSTSASDSKLIRVRGPLVNSSLGVQTYSVYVRPFYDEVNSLGSLSIFNTANTVYSLDGVQYVGPAGLQALSLTSAGSTLTASFCTFTPTVAQTTFAGIFTPVYVVAGSTLEDFYTDGLEGDVISRTGDTLVLRGSTLIANAAEVVQFNETDATLTLGPNTLVTADGVNGLTGLSSASISVGQHIIARGLYALNGTTVTLDATGDTATNTGSVRIQSTALAGDFMAAATGGLTLNLQTIDNYPASVFAFGDNGSTKPAAYQVNTGALALPAGLNVGDSLFIDGYTTAFGAAPPDFNALAVNAVATEPATMIVTWNATGTTAPFGTFDANSVNLSVDLTNNTALVSAVIRVGSQSIDMTTLTASPTVVPLVGSPPATGLPSLLLPVFGVGSTVGTISVFNTFPGFAAAATTLLGMTTSTTTPTIALKFTATGTYDPVLNVFTAANANLVL